MLDECLAYSSEGYVRPKPEQISPQPWTVATSTEAFCTHGGRSSGSEGRFTVRSYPFCLHSAADRSPLAYNMKAPFQCHGRSVGLATR